MNPWSAGPLLCMRCVGNMPSAACAHRALKADTPLSTFAGARTHRHPPGSRERGRTVPASGMEKEKLSLRSSTWGSSQGGFPPTVGTIRELAFGRSRFSEKKASRKKSPCAHVGFPSTAASRASCRCQEAAEISALWASSGRSARRHGDAESPGRWVRGKKVGDSGRQEFRPLVTSTDG